MKSNNIESHYKLFDILSIIKKNNLQFNTQNNLQYKLSYNLI